MYASATPSPTTVPSTEIPTTIPTSPELEIMQPPSSLCRDTIPPEAFETLRTIEAVDIPRRDLIDITKRLNDPIVCWRMNFST